MSRKLFGTDGIRGVANEQLSAELALAVGRAAVAVLPSQSPRIIIGRDTRISGPMLEAAIVAGISAAGGQAELAGVIPTPAVANLVVSGKADAGAVISASHNPYQDNGIKFFGPDGFKLTDEQEVSIERYLFHELTSGSGSPEPGPVCEFSRPAEHYIDNLLAYFDLDLSRLRVILDCANGAAYKTAPEALARLGADVTVTGGEPDGYNINSGCGSTHIGELQARVSEAGFDVGLAFDGDGDRVIAVDSGGNVVDGDFIMAMCAVYLKDQGRLASNTIVTTVMTNLGFHQAMAEAGISVRTTDVGDRYVLEEMTAGGFNFGGEQSGHIINLETGTAGDGLATSLLLLELVTSAGAPLAELTKVMRRLPQKLVNVTVPDREALNHADAVWTAIRRQEELLAGEGRILVRPSGTEPLVRVMVEAPTAGQCDTVCDNIVAAIEQNLA